jgi:hypothetical protein
MIAQGNATIASGNGTRLFANSTIFWGNNTTTANFTGTLPFFNYVVVNAGANAGNLSRVLAGNSAQAANVPFAGSLNGIANVPFTWSPGDVLQATGASTANANDCFLAASAQTVVTFQIV